MPLLQKDLTDIAHLLDAYPQDDSRVGAQAEVVVVVPPGASRPPLSNGSAWSNAGIQVVQRTPGSNGVTFTIDRVIGELSFFARPGAEILMPQISTLRLPPIE